MEKEKCQQNVESDKCQQNVEKRGKKTMLKITQIRARKKNYYEARFDRCSGAAGATTTTARWCRESEQDPHS